MGDLDKHFIAGWLLGYIDTGYDGDIDAIVQTEPIHPKYDEAGLVLSLTEGPGATPRKFRITVEEIK